jgi:hypothetical protein
MSKDLDVPIRLKVPEAVRDALEQAFGPFTNEKEVGEAIGKFNQLAFNAISAWLTGTKRYRSLTEQYIDWVEQIYLEFLPKDEMPSAERIYNSMNMPYGQAAYIARVLENKTLVQWRQFAEQELLAALKDTDKDARDYVKKKVPQMDIQICISKLAVQELYRICSYRRRSNKNYLMPKKGAPAGDYLYVGIPAGTIVDLIDNPKW